MITSRDVYHQSPSYKRSLLIGVIIQGKYEHLTIHLLSLYSNIMSCKNITLRLKA